MNDYYSMKSGRLLGGLRLKNWNDDRFDYVEHSELWSDETKNLIKGKGSVFDDVGKTTNDAFTDGKMNKYYDDFRTDDEIKEYPHQHNLISYKLPKKELV